jgi:uncharacterized protein (TIGR02453 family)
MRAKTFNGFPRESLSFLRSLRRNNNREWFQDHKTIYESALKQPMCDLVEAIGAAFETFAPEMIASTKASVYRIYRDTRFSKNKAPYKTHMAAIFPRKGLDKHRGAALYLHISPQELLIGGGVYMPLPEDLRAIRSHIAENSTSFLKIIHAAKFRKLFGTLGGEQLSRVPRGFSAEHPAADYLRHKQYLAARIMKPDVATTSDFYRVVIETFRGMLPLVRFLNEPILRSQRIRERQDAVLNEDVT